MRSRILIIGVLTASVLTPLACRVGGTVGQVSNLSSGEGQVGNLPHSAGAAAKQPTNDASYDWQFPDLRWQQKAFRHEQPISFVNRAQMPAEWDRLPAFWNKVTEKVADPVTGALVERKAVKIKVPLGLQQNPPVPAENPMTVAKWELGKKLYFDPILSSDGSVSCASCHDPRRGYTDQAAVSTGIKGSKGGISAPTVLNAAYSPLLFWDGRALSLEDQAQGPPQNPLEMFDGEGASVAGHCSRACERHIPWGRPHMRPPVPRRCSNRARCRGSRPESECRLDRALADRSGLAPVSPAPRPPAAGTPGASP